MAVVVLPGAQDDLLALQDDMLNAGGEPDWLKAEQELFDKLISVSSARITSWCTAS